LRHGKKQCLQPKDGLGYGWVFLKILGLGWVWVFAAPVWVGFRFLFFKKPGFRLGFGFFKIKKKMENFRQNLDEKRKKIIKIFQFFEHIAKHRLGCNGGKNQPKSMINGQPVKHKIVRLLNAGPTDLWQVGSKSVDDGF
jgi:hypothetical protein